MSYEKTTWQNGDIVAAGLLNHMEKGIAQNASDIEALREYESIFTGDVGESVQNWLDEHPEATTTIEDGSITSTKIAQNAITNDKLAADLKKPWYKIHDINLFGRMAEINLPVEASYPEAITYDSRRGLFYIGTHDYSGGDYSSEIVAIDINSYAIVSTNYYPWTIGSLSYNPITDKIYVAATGGNYQLYAVDADTMESYSILTGKTFSVGVQYDEEAGENVALQLSGTTAEFRTYDASWTQTGAYTVTIESTDTPQQDWAIKDGIAYICTWNSLLEIDFKNGDVHRLGLFGFKTGNEEPEGFATIGEDIYAVSFRSGTDGRCAIYKYGFSSAHNLVTNKFNNAYSFNISKVVGDYPTLFEFIKSMSPNDTAFLYHYSPTDNFSDLPTLYDGSAYIAEIFVHRPTGALEYTQIELCMHRVAEDVNLWRRFRGIIKRSSSTSITWAEYAMISNLIDQYAMGTAIPSGADLDDYTTAGVYAVRTSSIAGNVAHMPVAGAGRLEVRESIESGTGAYVVQTYYRTNTTACEIYHRVKTSNSTGFGTWKKVAYAT